MPEKPLRETKMLVGYARVSTSDQENGLAGQVEELKGQGCTEIFEEMVSAAKSRPRLEAMLQFVRKGDVVVITKLDRMARSVPDLIRIISVLEEKEVALKILAMGVDTHTPTGKLLISLMGSIATFEREIMLERQRIGIKAAKEAGRYKGRVPVALRQTEKVLQLRKQGLKATEIAKETGISLASTYRILKSAA